MSLNDETIIEMDTITIECSRCGHISVMASFAEGKCPNCGFHIAPPYKKPSKATSDIVVPSAILVVGLAMVKLAYYLIQRFIYGTGGEDLAGLIAIIGVAAIAICVILKRRKR